MQAALTITGDGVTVGDVDKASICGAISSYTGEWQGDNEHGHGVAKFAYGSCYVGDFDNDLRHGRGVFKEISV